MGRHFLTLVALLCFFSGEVATGQTFNYGFEFYSSLKTDVRDVSTVPGVEDLSLVVDFDHPENVPLKCGDALVGPPGGTVEVYGVATLENSEAGVVISSTVVISGEGADAEFLDVANPGYTVFWPPPPPETDFLYDLTASSDLIGKPVVFHVHGLSRRATDGCHDGYNGVQTAFFLGEPLAAGISRLLLFKLRFTVPVNGDIEAVEISYINGLPPCPRSISEAASNAITVDRGQGHEIVVPTLPPPCTFTVEATGGLFLRGDVNADGVVDITDPVSSLGFQFLRTFEPPCLDACDFDDSGVIDITDAVSSLVHQFREGPPPAAPGKETCGKDTTTDDELGCVSFAACLTDG